MHTTRGVCVESDRTEVSRTSVGMAGKEAVVFLVDCNGERPLSTERPRIAVRFLNPVCFSLAEGTHEQRSQVAVAMLQCFGCSRLLRGLELLPVFVGAAMRK